MDKAELWLVTEIRTERLSHARQESLQKDVSGLEDMGYYERAYHQFT